MRGSMVVVEFVVRPIIDIDVFESMRPICGHAGPHGVFGAFYQRKDLLHDHTVLFIGVWLHGDNRYACWFGSIEG